MIDWIRRPSDSKVRHAAMGLLTHPEISSPKDCQGTCHQLISDAENLSRLTISILLSTDDVQH
ncbi:hypothetical protein BJX96DRAFT_156041 [Aspergillus floccosus]